MMRILTILSHEIILNEEDKAKDASHPNLGNLGESENQRLQDLFQILPKILPRSTIEISDHDEREKYYTRLVDSRKHPLTMMYTPY
jgi:hypothetical protein